MVKKEVSSGLRNWFIAHFIVDMLFAIPLILFPSCILGLFGIVSDETMPRLVGAALIGIGGSSFLVRNKGKESYDILLMLKILWSLSAILGMVIALFLGASKLVFLILLVFVVFSAVWMYNYKVLNK